VEAGFSLTCGDYNPHMVRMFDVALAFAMLLVVLRGMRGSGIHYEQHDFAAAVPSRDVVVMLLLVMASSGIRVWRDPDAMSGWLALTFNAAVALVAIVVAQRRARRRLVRSAES
jgi:hypothetical protein